MAYHSLFDEPAPSAGQRVTVRNMFLDTVDDTLAATVLDHLNRTDARLRMVQLRVLARRHTPARGSGADRGTGLLRVHLRRRGLWSRAGVDAYARVFNPTVGIGEDPATGSAAGPFACHLTASGRATGAVRVLQAGA
jgi:hypothetical protein